MAIYHMSVKIGSRNNNKSAHAKHDYIAREGRYARRHNDVLYCESGHMPAWAGGDLGNPGDYWQAADVYERANGRLYREVEFALPVELPNNTKLKLARQVAHYITGAECLPYTLAIHDDRKNPHCHLVVNERVNDGVDRPVGMWFARHDSTRPHESGAKKTEKLNPRVWLDTLRSTVAEYINAELDRAGLAERVDCRSLEAQHINRIATAHEGPSDGPAHARRCVRNKSIRAENARRAAEERQREAILPDWAEDFVPLDLGREQWQQAMKEDQGQAAALGKAPEAAPKGEAVERPPMAATVIQPTASRRTEEPHRRLVTAEATQGAEAEATEKAARLVAEEKARLEAAELMAMLRAKVEVAKKTRLETEAAPEGEAVERGSPMAATVTQPTVPRRTEEAEPRLVIDVAKPAAPRRADEPHRRLVTAEAPQRAEAPRPPIKPPEPELAAGSRVEVRARGSTAKPLRGRVTALDAQKIWIWPDGGAGALPFARNKLEITWLPELDRQAAHRAAAERKPDRDLGR